MTSFSSHDFDNRIVVVAPCWVNGYTGGLVDDNLIVILMDDANRLSGDRRLMAMQRMGYHITILDD